MLRCPERTPCTRRGLFDREPHLDDVGIRKLRPGICDSFFRLAFCTRGNFLHHTNTAHRHAVGRSIEDPGASRREVVDTRRQFGIGQVAGTHSVVLRRLRTQQLRLHPGRTCGCEFRRGIETQGSAFICRVQRQRGQCGQGGKQQTRRAQAPPKEKKMHKTSANDRPRWPMPPRWNARRSRSAGWWNAVRPAGHDFAKRGRVPVPRWRSAKRARLAARSPTLPQAPTAAPAERWESAWKPDFARSATRTILDCVLSASSACHRNGPPWPCCRWAYPEASTRRMPAQSAGTAAQRSPAAQCAGERADGGEAWISPWHFTVYRPGWVHAAISVFLCGRIRRSLLSCCSAPAHHWPRRCCATCR